MAHIPDHLYKKIFEYNPKEIWENADKLELLALINPQEGYLFGNYDDDLLDRFNITDSVIDDNIENYFTAKDLKGIDERNGDGNFTNLWNPLLAEKIKIDTIELIKKRTEWFGTNYPFTIEGKKIKLTVSDINTNDIGSKLYLSLLVSSVFQIFGKAEQNLLGHAFEALCEPVFACLNSPISKIIAFRSGASEISTENQSNKLKNKLAKLADLLSNDINKRKIESISEKNTGDGGIDFVAVTTFNDGQSNNYIALAQCAAGENWVDKQFDAHPASIPIYFSAVPVQFFFQPRLIRDVKKNFELNNKISDELVFIDRLRFFEIINQNTSVLLSLEHLIEQYFTSFLNGLATQNQF